MTKAIIGIPADREGEKYTQAATYAAAVREAGGVPVILPHETAQIEAYLELCCGFVFAGGDDPNTEAWGVTTHSKARRIDAGRQAFELALMRRLDEHEHRSKPVFGICLGMQLMTLEAGGAIDQHLPDSNPAAASRHWGRVAHRVCGELGEGEVLSHHRQVMTDPGRLAIVARADDGTIEAVRDPKRAFFLGVQWHPERTDNAALGLGLFRQLVAASAVRVG